MDGECPPSRTVGSALNDRRDSAAKWTACDNQEALGKNAATLAQLVPTPDTWPVIQYLCSIYSAQCFQLPPQQWLARTVDGVIMEIPRPMPDGAEERRC